MNDNTETDVKRLPEPYQQFYADCRRLLPNNRIHADPLRTLAFGTDASVYRMIPKLVIKVRTRDEVAHILRAAHKFHIPVTFRAAGTSLSGQSVTDSVLVVLAGGWGNFSIAGDGKSITLEPGILGADANAMLKEHSRKIGPDPASINHAMIGGIAANNASGMCCGTTDNSYKTVAEMKIIFHDGTLLDTADPQSCADFSSSHAELISEIERIRDEISADQELGDTIRRKFKIKNTCGYSINAFVDHSAPIEIIKHLMIGSEGTLGFIAEITFRTIIDHAHKSSTLIFFPDIENACHAVMQLDRETVSATEMMDRQSLKSVEEKPGMPPYLKTLDKNVTALLIEVRGESHEQMEQKCLQVKKLLSSIPKLFPITFVDKKEDYEALWNIRKGLFPAVGNVRPIGTSVIIEDIAFPIENLADATLELRRLMIQHDYADAIIFGHALDGNLHFVLTPDFTREEQVKQYEDFMQDVCNMVVGKYSGSLKAEHGTGRNMAPFVPLEWGKKAYDLMKRIKNAFDPQELLNPGVIINENPNVYLENLKPMPQAGEIIDKCIECGFCEINCPSKELTSTPRQRITSQRKIAELRRSGKDPELLRRLEEDYVYWGEQTCAADGLCATTCPVSINTGQFTKQLRHAGQSARAISTADFVARNFSGITTVIRSGLNLADFIHRVLGTPLMIRMASGSRDLTNGALPLWTPWMPKGAKSPQQRHSSAPSERPKVVYFPSCVGRTMGPALHDHDQRPLNQAVLSLLEKAGYDVILPPDMDKLCCGMAFESKGFFEAAEKKTDELCRALLECSNNGEYPIFCDTSPCLYRMRQTLDKRLSLFEPVEFIHEFLMDRLLFSKKEGTIALHITCSATKMLLTEKFKAVAAACADRIIIPPKITCCGFAGSKGFDLPELNEIALAGLKQALPPDCSAGYSNSRTCEIGLSLHGGISYQSIVYLVDRCTEKLPPPKMKEKLLESTNWV